jgi:hypothetical protein
VTTDNLPDTVSREAHQEMTDKRNALKAENEVLGNRLTDMAFTDTARQHFSSKGVDDPDWAAKVALPSIKASNTELGDIGTYLDDEFARLYPEVPTEGDPPPVDDGVPTPDAVEPPGFARPSPASEGAPVDGQKKYLISDPHVQAILEANDKAAFEALDKAGQIAWRTKAP